MSEDDGKRVADVAGGSVLTGPGRREGERNERGDDEKRARAAGNGAGIPDPEVSARPKRRRFPASYKARIVEEAQGCTESGQVGALLRREGLYSSQLAAWRKQYRAGALTGLRDDKRGRKRVKHPLEDENERLRKQNVRLQRRLEQAEAIIEIQKKVSAMLGIPLNSIEDEDNG